MSFVQPKQPVERRTYTVPEAAAVAGVNIQAIYRGVKSGAIPHIRNGRSIIIPKMAFHNYIDTAGGTVEGVPHVA